jgi:hypothetical protein
MRVLRILGAGLLLMAASPASAGETAADAAAIKDQGLTGSLLAPSPATFAKGVFAVEPYFLYRRGAGSFGPDGVRHASPAGGDQFRAYSSLQYGITDDLALQLLPGFAQALSGDRAIGVSDLPVRLKYRWFGRGEIGFWHPSLTTGLGVSVPIGRYQRLSSSADGFGAGAWMGNFQAQMQNVFAAWHHPNRARIWMNVSAPLGSVAVHGISTYGTGQGFSGTALPATSVQVGIADEFALDRHWVLALDIAQEFSRAAHVHGTGAPGPHSGSRFVVAPALEYNFTNWIGVIAGVEYAPAGHNASAAITPQVAVNMFFY